MSQVCVVGGRRGRESEVGARQKREEETERRALDYTLSHARERERDTGGT